MMADQTAERAAMALLRQRVERAVGEIPAYDPSDPAHFEAWRELVRQRVEQAMDLPEGLTLVWEKVTDEQ